MVSLLRPPTKGGPFQNRGPPEPSEWATEGRGVAPLGANVVGTLHLLTLAQDEVAGAWLPNEGPVRSVLVITVLWQKLRGTAAVARGTSAVVLPRSNARALVAAWQARLAGLERDSGMSPLDGG